MQNDSVPFSTSDHIQEVEHQDAKVKSYQCSHCTLIFKSKVYLFEHLNKVHGFDVDAALRDAGLKQSGTHNADIDSNSSGNNLKCQHCDFKACDLDVLNKHEKQCQKESETPNVTGTLNISENPAAKITVVSTNHHNESIKAMDIPSVMSVLALTQNKSTLSSLRDLKTYKRPSQTITKYFTTSSGSNEKSPVKLADATQGTLILQESPSSSSTNSSGVFQVTAKPAIDINKFPAHYYLQHDPIWTAELIQTRPKEDVPNNVGKRTGSDSSEICPAKKAKLDKGQAKIPQKENSSKQQSPNSTDFSFEVSEDEEEKKGRRVNEDTALYFCKHCDYSDVGIQRMSSHYQSDHPYIRCSAVYIQDSSDQSATFRCLDCPTEFLSAANLKKHYRECHPGSPDVFTMKSSELSLVFTCFLCPFTNTVLKALKEHYKEKHPTHHVGNSLLFCRYSLTGCQRAFSQQNKCEKTPNKERQEEIYPEKARASNTEDINATLPQPTASKGADVALYKCNNCTFSHKSVVVMHVHYQKTHPDEALTIDKIKQSARATSHAPSQMTPEKSAKSAQAIVSSVPLQSISDSSTATENKAEPSPQKLSLFLVNPKHIAATSPDQSPKTKNVESVKDGNKTKKPPIKYDSDVTPVGSSLPVKKFYCQFCHFTSSKLRGVIGHHNAKHSMHLIISTDDVLQYSAEMRKKKKEAKTSKGAPSSHSKPSNQVEVCSETVHHAEDDAADASMTEDHPYACAENLFYCTKCNYGNPYIKGILNHHAKVHNGTPIMRESIIDHTALVREEIKKSKSQPKELSFSTHLPLPLMNDGDENMFFCHFCNYRNRTMIHVLKHYSKSHYEFKVNPAEIQLYTSMVLKRTQKAHLRTAVNQEVNQKSLVKMKKGKKKAKTFLVSAPPAARTSQPQRALHCNRCQFSTRYVYLLRRHIWKSHHTKQPVAEVLKLCFEQGVLKPGYHCEFCLFTHTKATSVFKHYQEKHPGRRLSLEYVTTRLYVGSETSPQQEENSELQHTVRDDDGADLNSKKTSENSHVDELSQMPVFESYQVPLEFDKSSDEVKASSPMFKCPYCPAVVNTQRGLKTHCGLKHRAAVHKNVNEPPKQEQVKTRVHVFKCPYCAYVNTIYQGVLTHCQMKHPDLISRAESLYVDRTHLQNLEEKNNPGGSLKFSGHMCTICSQIFMTQEKLTMHCESNHDEMAASAAQGTLKPAATPSAASKPSLSKTYSAQRSKLSKASFLNKMYTMIKCQQCSYTSRTKLGLNRHMCIQHKYAVSKDCVYKCVLCYKTYFWKKHLAGHYVMKHGKDAYFKHYVQVYKQVPEKASSPHHPLKQQSHITSDSFESNITKESNKLLVYKCPSCSYVNASYHGTLTHCQMKHPTIVVRAEKLKTDQISVTNMVKCTLGKGSNRRGYMCKKCPQIHASLANLRIHCKSQHGQKGVSEHLAETENQPVHSAQGSALEAASLENEASEESITENEPSPQSGAPETLQTNSLLLQIKAKLYKCQMCNYRGLHRRYLQTHYKHTHKLDVVSTAKLLERYNKRNIKKASVLSESVEPEESVDFKCKKCPDVMFDSSQLLADHYSSFHRKLDFIVLSIGSRPKSTGLYKCSHCSKQLNGIRKVCLHLDKHRAVMKEAAKRQASLVLTTTPEPESVQLCGQDALPTLEPMEVFTQSNVTPVDISSLPTSPLKSPSKLSDAEQPEMEIKESKPACNQCGRTFRSRRGLRSHERSHAAVAAIKNLHRVPTSALKSNINKYVLYKSGTMRPFVCSFCSYRTTVLGLFWSHFMKKHQDVILDPAETADSGEERAQRADNEPFNSSGQTNDWDELDEEPEVAENSLYLEPPDVQRQLNHYSLMAQKIAKSKANSQGSKPPGDRLLQCEMCNFSTGHLSSIRRHYLHRHGKKILRCKDCSFVTGLRKTLEVHLESGHSTCQPEATHQKDIRCPFCLYQTKNKNNMIDHIVMHREERIVPIEVRRPKLSRYLQGVVFRCHKCTFTSGSAENLHLHMKRHNEVRPYKCRLCYFDCTRLSDLEEHLSDKHQVVRNHELVGQVSLDQLEARDGRMPETEEEPNLERCSDDTEDTELVTECEDPAENNNEGKIKLQINEAHQKRGQDGDEENPDKIPVSDIHTTVEKKHEQGLLKQAGTARAQNVEEGNAEIQFEDRNGPEKEREDQPKLEYSEDSSITLMQQEEKEVKESPMTYFKMAEKEQAHKRHIKALKQRTLNIEARVEEDILHNILLLDEDGSFHKTDKKAGQERAVKTEQITEDQGADKAPSDVLLPDEHSSTTLAQNQAISASAMTNPAQTKARKSLINERHSQTLPPNCAQLKLSREDGLGGSFTNWKEEQAYREKSREEIMETYGEMPVLENEYLKEEVCQLESCKKEEENDDLDQKQDEETDRNIEDDGKQRKEQDSPHMYKVLCASLSDEKRYTCELCGRNLVSSSELKRHVMRHGM